MKKPYAYRKHHYGCSAFFGAIFMILLVSSFTSTYFPCYEADLKLSKEQAILYKECEKLCDTVGKFKVLVDKHHYALYKSAGQAVVARKNFYKNTSVSQKAAAYYQLKASLVKVADGLDGNDFAMKDRRWKEVAVDMRNITNRVGKIQIDYNKQVDLYNLTLEGKRKKYWLKILDFKPAEYFKEPANKPEKGSVR